MSRKLAIFGLGHAGSTVAHQIVSQTSADNLMI